jgi:hypothetical protein
MQRNLLLQKLAAIENDLTKDSTHGSEVESVNASQLPVEVDQPAHK